MPHPTPPELIAILRKGNSEFRRINSALWDEIEAEIKSSLVEVYQAGKAAISMDQMLVASRRVIADVCELLDGADDGSDGIAETAIRAAIQRIEPEPVT